MTTTTENNAPPRTACTWVGKVRDLPFVDQLRVHSSTSGNRNDLEKARDLTAVQRECIADLEQLCNAMDSKGHNGAANHVFTLAKMTYRGEIQPWDTYDTLSEHMGKREPDTRDEWVSKLTDHQLASVIRSDKFRTLAYSTRLIVNAEARRRATGISPERTAVKQSTPPSAPSTTTTTRVIDDEPAAPATATMTPTNESGDVPAASTSHDTARAQAEREWLTIDQSQWISKAAYVGYRRTELEGRIIGVSAGAAEATTPTRQPKESTGTTTMSKTTTRQPQPAPPATSLGTTTARQSPAPPSELPDKESAQSQAADEWDSGRVDRSRWSSRNTYIHARSAELRGLVSFVGVPDPRANRTTSSMNEQQAKAQAESEWDSGKVDRTCWMSRAAYVGWRRASLMGRCR